METNTASKLKAQLSEVQEELRQLQRAIPPLPEPQQLYEKILRTLFSLPHLLIAMKKISKECWKTLMRQTPEVAEDELTTDGPRNHQSRYHGPPADAGRAALHVEGHPGRGV
ncbi:hypothetical protein ANCDUO_03620 [Ancylostoma duodenale]|uniref:Uncharacterized protein n=1 Tax=Ancylostoma duodenale TaxID=51022 RepID=A0A0C2H939_9BILA|nr:hypothetical protein ANCDUO_03620 [Ancylostoma duodenale]